MRFLVDAQLPPRLCRWLTDKGHQSIHVTDWEGGSTMPDAHVWERAKVGDWIICSKDVDFRERLLLLGPPPQVVQVAVGNCSNRQLLAYLDAAWDGIESALGSGASLVVVTPTHVEIFEG